MSLFRSGHHPALRRWQRLVGVSEDAVCRLCDEGVEYAERNWQQCPALLVDRHHSDLGHMMDEYVRLPRAAQALLGIIIRRLWQQQQQQRHQLLCTQDRGYMKRKNLRSSYLHISVNLHLQSPNPLRNSYCPRRSFYHPLRQFIPAFTKLY